MVIAMVLGTLFSGASTAENGAYRSNKKSCNTPVDSANNSALYQREDFRERVVESVRWQMKNYPESRLRDLYKNFFQDKFGPGHIVADTASAGAYLRRELAEVNGRSQCEYVEVTGWEGNFVRVDLAVIKENIIDYERFFDAFIKSTSLAKAPSVDEWRLEWREIESIVRQLFPDIPALNEDSKTLDTLLSQGKYIVHHSKDYADRYKPHYRLISRTILSALAESLFIDAPAKR
jgi:hypothetical protein